MPVTKKAPLRDIGVIAYYELLDALRSRRVLILLLLFVGGAIGGTLIFAQGLQSLEATLAQALETAEPDKAGALTGELMRSPEFLRMLGGLLDDEALAKELAALPPLALFYGWLGLTFLPALIVLTAAEALSGELASGTLRFSLLRTSRLNFSLGKLAGQTLLMLFGVVMGALAVWITGYISLASFEGPRSALWLALLSIRIAFYAFAYVGLAVGLSHFTRSVPLSRALALGSLFLFGALHGIGTHYDALRERAGALVDGLLTVLPRHHMLQLWQPVFLDRMPALAMLAALGFFYFTLGYLFRVRRDA